MKESAQSPSPSDDRAAAIVRASSRAPFSAESRLSASTHPCIGIIQHIKNDEDVGILGSLDCRQDSIFAFEEKASSIRNYEE